MVLGGGGHTDYFGLNPYPKKNFFARPAAGHVCQTQYKPVG